MNPDFIGASNKYPTEKLRLMVYPVTSVTRDTKW